MKGAERERGIALIAVLWAVMLLAAIAASFVTSARTETRMSRNFIGQAAARALADAGVYRGVHALLEPSPARRWKADGTLYVFALGGGEVAVALEDEGGKIDLNVAPPELLEGLLASAGLAAEESATLARRIVDRRDRRGFHAARAGATARPFHSVEELRSVAGMTAALFEAMAPALTIYSRQPGLDPATASRRALSAIPGLNAQDIDAIIDARAAPAGQLMARVPALARAARFLSRSAGVACTIKAQGRSRDRSVFVRKAVVLLTHDPASPYTVYAWTQHDEPLTK
jgi:general secretion pathway protein K